VLKDARTVQYSSLGVCKRTSHNAHQVSLIIYEALPIRPFICMAQHTQNRDAQLRGLYRAE